MLQPKNKDDDKKQDGEKMGSGRAIPVRQVSSLVGLHFKVFSHSDMNVRESMNVRLKCECV